MLVEKRIPLRMILQVEGKSIFCFLLLATIVYLFHRFSNLNVEIPISIAATIGTAVAILLGFKNNAAYERWWEARKIWGAIVNSSRTFGAQLLTYIDSSNSLPHDDRQRLLVNLVHRHFAYINALRLQLRDLPTEPAINRWLSADDTKKIEDAHNKATQILTIQATCLRKLSAQRYLRQFRVFEFMQTIGAFFDHQGKAERIKGTPLMRHYSNFTTAFVWIFVLLLPFCFVGALGWRMIPLVVLVSQIFRMLDRAGSFTENPFTNDFNSIPLDAICRTIEIDMLQQIGESDIPSPVEPVQGVLM